MNMSSLSQVLGKASDEVNGPIQNGSAAARVYGALRTKIVSMEILPDTVLSRIDIAKENNVSQSPVREAIQKLEQEGLVVSFPQSKTIVTKINVVHAQESQLLRLSVEIEIAKTLIQRNDPELLLPAKRILRMQKMAGEDRDIAEFTALDRLFHLSLFQAVDAASLWHLISNRLVHIDRLRILNLPDPGKIAAVLKSHDQIIAAVEKSDIVEVEAVTREHLSGTLAALPDIMASYPKYFGETNLQVSE